MDGAGEMEEHRAVANKGGSDTPVSDHRATPVHNNHRGTPVNNHRDDAPAADDDAPSHRGNSSTRSRTSEHDNANYGDVSASRLAAAVSPSSTAHHRGGKVRADYLLNFTLPPRPSPAAGGQRSGSTPRRHGFIQTVGQSRDRFVNANFRFILSMNMTERRRIALAAQSDLLIGTHGSFSPTTTDSGDEVRWADVEQAVGLAWEELVVSAASYLQCFSMIRHT